MVQIRPTPTRDSPSGGAVPEVGGTSHWTYVSRSGCWTWRTPSSRRRFFGRIGAMATLSRAGVSGRVNFRWALASGDCRKAARSEFGSFAPPRFAVGQPACRRATCATQTVTKGAKLRQRTQRIADGYCGTSQMHWKGKEAHGSIGCLRGGDVTAALRTRRRSKALRSTAQERESGGHVLHRTRAWQETEPGWNGGRASTTVTWHGCRRGESFEGCSATGDGPRTV